MSEEFHRETNEKRASLLKRHRQVLDRFDALWSSAIPRQYRKASHQLLQLKQVEKTLANAGEYDRAMEVREEVDELTALEQALAQQKLVKDYRRGRANVLARQAREVELFESARDGAKKVMEAKHFTEMNAAITRDLVQQRKPQENSRAKAIGDTAVARVRLGAERRQEHELLLPPLKPPTDPSIAQEEDERRRAAAKQKQLLIKRREDEQRAKMEMIEKFQRETRELTAAQKPATIQTFVTSTEDVPVKVERATEGQSLTDAGEEATTELAREEPA
jgi:hypothetical protein